MSRTQLPGLPSVRGVLLAGVLGGALAGAAAAQGPTKSGERDLLDETRRLHQIQTQKVEADVRLGLREAERLGMTDPVQGAKRIQAVLALIQDDKILAPERRAALTRMLKDRLRLAEARADGTLAEEAARDDRLKQLGEKKEADRKLVENQDKLARMLRQVKVYRADGKMEEAVKLAEDAARGNPDGTAANASARITKSAEQVATARKIQADKERGTLGAFRDIDRSAVIPEGDIAFPKDWKERTKGRTNALQLTAKERAILQSLNSTIPVKFKNTPLQDVLEYIKTYTGQEILLDQSALKEAEISSESPVNLQVRDKIAVRTALRTILSSLNLTYVVKDEVILVTSAERAKGLMVTRAYYLGDIVTASLLTRPGFLGVNTAALNEAELIKNVQGIIEMITTSVDPSSWFPTGGGIITFNRATMSLIIRQSTEVHAMLGSGQVR